MRARWIAVGLVLVSVGGGFTAVAKRPGFFSRAVHEAAAAPAVHRPRTVHAEGRVTTRPGKEVKLSAELQGRVENVLVTEGQTVKRGDLLAELNRTEYAAALQEASGLVSEASARVRARKDDLRRSKTLVESGSLSKQEAVRLREDKAAADGRLVASFGAAEHARALLVKTRIVAPIDGVVVARFVNASETVAPGAPLFVVADLEERRVEAEVDEFDVGRVNIGTRTNVTADGFAGKSWEGTVEEVPSAVQARRLRPQDPARPTDTAVLLVKVSLPKDSPLKLGQRVNVALEEDVAPPIAGTPQG